MLTATTPVPPFTLYAKAGCHLCDEARDLLASHGLPVVETDIAGDPELQRRYGWRIPVLRTGTGVELDWPFGPVDLQELLARE